MKQNCQLYSLQFWFIVLCLLFLLTYTSVQLSFSCSTSKSAKPGETLLLVFLTGSASIPLDSSPHSRWLHKSTCPSVESRAETKIRIWGIIPMCAQSHLAPYDPIDCSPLGSSVHELFPERRLEWVPCLSPGDGPSPGSDPHPRIAGRFFAFQPPGKPCNLCRTYQVWDSCWGVSCSCFWPSFWVWLFFPVC